MFSAVVGQPLVVVFSLNRPELSGSSRCSGLVGAVAGERSKRMARRRSWGGGGGGGGNMLGKVLTAILLIYVLFMFVINFVPEIETAVTGFTSTLPMVETMVGIVSWLLPVGALVIAAVMLFKHIKS